MQLEMKSKIRYLEISLYVISVIEYLQAELSILFYTYSCRMQNIVFQFHDFVTANNGTQLCNNYFSLFTNLWFSWHLDYISDIVLHNDLNHQLANMTLQSSMGSCLSIKDDIHCDKFICMSSSYSQVTRPWSLIIGTYWVPPHRLCVMNVSWCIKIFFVHHKSCHTMRLVKAVMSLHFF